METKKIKRILKNTSAFENELENMAGLNLTFRKI